MPFCAQQSFIFWHFVHWRW